VLQGIETIKMQQKDKHRKSSKDRVTSLKVNHVAFYKNTRVIPSCCMIMSDAYSNTCSQAHVLLLFKWF
jgi:hypothetical protein